MADRSWAFCFRIDCAGRAAESVSQTFWPLTELSHSRDGAKSTDRKHADPYKKHLKRNPSTTGPYFAARPVQVHVRSHFVACDVTAYGLNQRSGGARDSGCLSPRPLLCMVPRRFAVQGKFFALDVRHCCIICIADIAIHTRCHAEAAMIWVHAVSYSSFWTWSAWGTNFGGWIHASSRTTPAAAKPCHIKANNIVDSMKRVSGQLVTDTEVSMLRALAKGKGLCACADTDSGHSHDQACNDGIRCSTLNSSVIKQVQTAQAIRSDKSRLTQERTLHHSDAELSGTCVT